MTLYPDASILIAAIVSEPMTTKALLLLEGAGTTLATSEWTLTEMASALAIKERTGQLKRDDRIRALDSARSLTANSFAFHPVTSANCRTATILIERSALPLRGGDALHLAIAADRGATSWTLDRRMAAAGQALGLDARLLE